MKKFTALALASSLLVGATALIGCDNGNDGELTLNNVKVGLICLHDLNSSYDENFITSMYDALDELGMSRKQLKLSTGIPEGTECYEEAKRLAKKCDVIFADSFGHEDYMIQAAKENPDVQFAHATGVKAHTENLPNFANAFASIYEGRYVVGIAAGLKLNEMIQNGDITESEAKIGYVGAWSFAEVISGFTSFYLGAKSVCPTVTMEVKFTGSWFDYDLEYQTAKDLIGNGCKLISQHADSYGAPQACEESNVPNVTYNISTETKCPNTYLVATKINWTPYFKYLIQSVVDKTPVVKDYVGTIDNGSVVVLSANSKNCATGTQTALDEAIANLKAGTLKVFDTSKFTIEDATLTEYMADVDSDPEYQKDTQVVDNGEFQESKFRSGPYFDAKIDGITWLNSAY